ncbi:hypothetical protein Aspvir_007384 [Aspergillus viridinutans]|uniref:Uncharacterized protein n=1 Tax=Aspergillus viridinutans TaxID=75553 RepID=A0A9P3BW20_ASPVI|nr:uncharacterized protein Aspvir_007384 [Aspergillus viridinutans]GIK03315.1 hypothetical protein Aspvir_007384 [Aspergillus viridinutans]
MPPELPDRGASSDHGAMKERWPDSSKSYPGMRADYRTATSPEFPGARKRTPSSSERRGILTILSVLRGMRALIESIKETETLVQAHSEICKHEEIANTLELDEPGIPNFVCESVPNFRMLHASRCVSRPTRIGIGRD